MTRSPFIRVNRPQRGGAHDFEALVLDVIDRCCLTDPIRFVAWCRAARGGGQTLEVYVGDKIRKRLDEVTGARVEAR